MDVSDQRSLERPPDSLAAAVAGALGPATEAPAPVRLPAPAAAPARARRRLWDIPPKHHCVLLGAAFDARELRQMFRRAGFATWETASDYELHSSAVCFAKDRNEFSALAQRCLEKRYAALAARFAAARTATEILGLWRACAVQGEAVAAYWVALTHPELDAEADESLSREMHMIGHAEFAVRRAALRRVRALEIRIADLLANQAAQRERIEALLCGNRELRTELHASRSYAAQAWAELERWRSGEIASIMQARRAELESALAIARAERDDAQRSLREATRRLERLGASRRAVEQPPPATTPCGTDTAPAASGLSPPPGLDCRRLLCIGGKRAVVAQYRALVEGARGEFSYHDGGVEDHIGRLPAMLAAADAVVCLAGDCSHAAYRLAKRYCKAKGKPYALLGNSSLSALARCIGEHFRFAHPILQIEQGRA
jgi:hypothetical protein